MADNACQERKAGLWSFEVGLKGDNKAWPDHYVGNDEFGHT